MGRARRSERNSQEDRALRLVDDLVCDQLISPSELDAVTAFLMQTVNAILSDANIFELTDTVQTPDPAAAVTHIRRKCLAVKEA